MSGLIELRQGPSWFIAIRWKLVAQHAGLLLWGGYHLLFHRRAFLSASTT